MHPAPSIIFFTVLSGVGFGILAVYMLDPSVLLLGRPVHPFWALLVAYAFAVTGLLCSTFHLANKKNAIKSFRQWRTSWLSREAWLAVITLGAGGIYGLWLMAGQEPIRWVGWVIAALALFTVFCTSMIYTQIRAVPRWHQALTPMMFLAYALAAGAWFFATSWVILALIVAAMIQILHWQQGDRTRYKLTDRNAATGLKGIIAPLFPPHSAPNYLMKEMAYQIGRKHAHTLRVITLVFAFVVPALMSLMLPMLWFTWGLGFCIHLVGVFAGRWLFFAEAEHSVALYY